MTRRPPGIDQAATADTDAGAVNTTARRRMTMRRRLIIVSLAATVAAVAAAFAGASQSTYPGGRGRLAFAVNRANVDIYSVLPNGGGVQRLTTERAFDACPSWSRDGKTIAYCSDASGAFEIWTMRADGSGKHRETNLDSNATFPDLSSDGTKIVFSDCARTCRLMVVDRATGKESVLVDDKAADDTDPVWSPNGRLIAFLRAPKGRSLRGAQIYIARADGSRVRQVTKDRLPKGPFGPDWRPDGAVLAYASGGDIWTADLRGRTRRVTSDKASEFAPAWSPDGSQIAYIRRTAAVRQIYAVRANGSGPRPAAPAVRGAHLAPSWQPVAPR
jgi:Tol biopolymer transport system component